MDYDDEHVKQTTAIILLEMVESVVKQEKEVVVSVSTSFSDSSAVKIGAELHEISTCTPNKVLKEPSLHTPQLKDTTNMIELNGPSYYDFSHPNAEINLQILNEMEGELKARTPPQKVVEAIQQERKIQHEKFKGIKDKPLTRPISPDFHCSKRDFRCTDHNCHQHSRTRTSIIPFESIVSRVHSKEEKAFSILKRTEPHSPFLETAHRAKLKPTSETTIEYKSGWVLPQELFCRENNPPVDYIAKATEPHSPELATARRAKPVTSAPYNNGVIDAASLVRRRGKFDKENIQPTRGPTKAYSPLLLTTKRSRVLIETPNEDDVELAKQFHAKPVRRQVLAGSVIQPPKKKAKTIPMSPNLQSLARHKEYRQVFQHKMEEELKEENERMNSFKAQPMPLYTETNTGLSTIQRRPLTEIEPFNMPGERFEELAKERLMRMRQEDAENAKKLAVVKARPIVLGSNVSMGNVATKPLTECYSPNLAVKRRAMGRAEFDAKDRARREEEAELKQRRDEEERVQEAAEIKKWRETLSFKHYVQKSKRNFL